MVVIAISVTTMCLASIPECRWEPDPDSGTNVKRCKELRESTLVGYLSGASPDRTSNNAHWDPTDFRKKMKVITSTYQYYHHYVNYYFYFADDYFYLILRAW